nr:melanin-concentrating hormone receptor 1-like [Dromaius novaehollandiae]
MAGTSTTAVFPPGASGCGLLSGCGAALAPEERQGEEQDDHVDSGNHLLHLFLCWAPYFILQLVHLGVAQPTVVFLDAYNTAVRRGYTSCYTSVFTYSLLSNTFPRRRVKAIRPAQCQVSRDTSHGKSLSQ